MWSRFKLTAKAVMAWLVMIGVMGLIAVMLTLSHAAKADVYGDVMTVVPGFLLEPGFYLAWGVSFAVSLPFVAPLVIGLWRGGAEE